MSMTHWSELSPAPQATAPPPDPPPSTPFAAAEARDPLLVDYRRSRGWNPEPGPKSRISLELPRDLVARLNRQARSTGIARHSIIETAVIGLLAEWEQIDSEERPG